MLSDIQRFTYNIIMALYQMIRQDFLTAPYINYVYILRLKLYSLFFV